MLATEYLSIAEYGDRSQIYQYATNMDQKLIILLLPCPVLSAKGSVLQLVGPVSVQCHWVQQHV